MIPIQLNIKGLYSYQDNTTIDFQPLIKAGLFGIFGPVGSGKSAILEAIMFVLFDRSTRLNKAGDDRYYNMMNLQSNEMIIDFIFRAGRNNEQKFRFYFKARRKAKDFYKVDVKDRSHYQWSKNDWLPLEQEHQVVGMTYENFMQTVIIPQGKFREFIDQKPAARTQMLKELFHLEKYDLAPQAHSLLHDVRDKLTFLEGQLSQYQEVHEEGIEELQKETKGLEQEVKTNLGKQKELVAQNMALLDLQLQAQELLEVNEILNTLNLEKDFYQSKEQQLRRFEKATSLFKVKIDLQQDYLIDLKEKQESISASILKSTQLQESLSKTQKHLDQAQLVLKNKDKWRIEIEDLGLLIDYNKQQAHFETLTEQWKLEQQQIEQLKTNETKLLKELDHWKIQRDKYQGAEKAYQLWLDKARWWKRHEELQRQYDRTQNEWESLKKEVKGLLEEKDSLLKSAPRLTQINGETNTLRARLQDLKIQEDWHVHAQHLTDGKPCPLCGATHHPKILTTKGLNEEVKEIEKELQKLSNEESKVREVLQKAEIIAVSIKHKALQGNNLKKQLEEIMESLVQHKKEFPESEKVVDAPKNLTATLKQQQQQAEESQLAQHQLNQLQEQYRELQQQNLARITALQETSLKKEQLQGALDQKLLLVKVLDSKKYLYRKETELVAQMGQLREASTSAALAVDQFNEKLSSQKQELAKQEALLEALQKETVLLSTKSEKLEKELTTLCEKESFKGVVEVQKILFLNLNGEIERSEILKYRENLKAYTSRVQLLQKRIGKSVYRENDHLDVRNKLEELTEALEKQQHLLSGKQHALQKKQEQLKRKISITNDRAKLSIRKEHLQEISNLLRGNSFINFISSAYLQNLCKMANERFSKLTSNRLSLELNDQNDFMVRDYLNEGKLRLLKTLSGGQIFQASLCLALALAENVKSLNQADQSFFFLDEGFGSLDKSSIQTVFNTLKSLQKENRIVGIISHVEELQQEIDVSLFVKQVGEKGSKIVPSWESMN